LLAGLDPHWLIRSQTTSAALAASVADVVQSAEPRLPLVSFATLDAVIGNHIAQERALFALLAVFAGIALLLACIGTYGLMAYSVSARSREVGIRMALGATAPRVVAHFLHEGLIVVLAGAVVGLIGALVVARGVSAFVWGLAPFDPVTFTTIVFMVGGIVMLAVAIPALRAARVSPARVLRGD
jgi:ABC-type antimicrobial peptide transport system permease subunit